MGYTEGNLRYKKESPYFMPKFYCPAQKPIKKLQLITEIPIKKIAPSGKI